MKRKHALVQHGLCNMGPTTWVIQHATWVMQEGLCTEHPSSGKACEVEKLVSILIVIEDGELYLFNS